MIATGMDTTSAQLAKTVHIMGGDLKEMHNRPEDHHRSQQQAWQDQKIGQGAILHRPKIPRKKKEPGSKTAQTVLS
jgi:hypothetical protein